MGLLGLGRRARSSRRSIDRPRQQQPAQPTPSAAGIINQSIEIVSIGRLTRLHAHADAPAVRWGPCPPSSCGTATPWLVVLACGGSCVVGRGGVRAGAKEARARKTTCGERRSRHTRIGLVRGRCMIGPAIDPSQRRVGTNCTHGPQPFWGWGSEHIDESIDRFHSWKEGKELLGW